MCHFLSLTRSGAPRLIKCFQHLVGPRTDSDVFREIHPTHCAVIIDEKFRRPRNVSALWSRAGVQHVITTDHFRFPIGKQQKGESELLTLPPIDLGRVHADADDTNAARVEFRKPSLETPQLGVA
jgi:hypothetical protein